MYRPVRQGILHAKRSLGIGQPIALSFDEKLADIGDLALKHILQLLWHTQRLSKHTVDGTWHGAHLQQVCQNSISLTG